MNVILLSGGSGTRLWPLSNEVRSKQFLKIFDFCGKRESMVQRMYRKIKSVDADADITIATSQNQVPQIKDQLGGGVRISVEPCRRDTFPAIALACAYLAKCGKALSSPVVVCPVDPLVDDSYFECLKKLSERASEEKHNITLMGINPTSPSEKFGYILTQGDDVRRFCEKPDRNTAERYISDGALWNGGVFAFRLGYMTDIARKMLGTSDHDTMLENYSGYEKISIDYAVVEKEKSIGVIRYGGAWQDLGTWETLSGAMADACRGNAVCAECENTHVINELGIPLIALGINNAVIAATPDGILVTDKGKSAKLKDYVAQNRPMYERREWGEYKVLDYSVGSGESNFLTKHIVIGAGKHISYQLHRRRTEIWTVTEGEGTLVLDGKTKKLRRGDTAVIPPLSKHGIKAESDLHIIEVQLGDELTEDDIERFDFDPDTVQ